MNILKIHWRRIPSLALAICLPAAALLPLFLTGSTKAAPVHYGVSPQSAFALAPGTNPYYMVQGPDGNFWFTENTTDQIAKYNPNTQALTEYALAAGSGPIGITVGPDSNLWFTENGTNKIGKITTAGSITEYTTGGLLSPFAITAGPDGNLWYTNNLGGIAKVTTSGVFTSYTIGSGIIPNDLTTGPDGNLWAVGPGAKGLAKVTTSGVVTLYTIPTSGSDPQGITTGPDGNLWFTETLGHQIAKVTTSGTITEYPNLANASMSPVSITTSPDGNLWFTDQGVVPCGTDTCNQLGEVTTSGTFTQYLIPNFDSSSPSTNTSLVLGADNNLWFTHEHYIERTVNNFPAISSVTPDPADTGGGTSVTIAGENFRAGATVAFLDPTLSTTTPATGVTVVNGGEITATVPATPLSGAGQVVVTNSDGSYAYFDFTFTAPPATITSVTFGDDGFGNQAMLIHGTGLTSGGAIITTALAQRVVTLNGTDIPFCTDSTLDATALNNAGVPSNEYTDSPPCFELLGAYDAIGPVPSDTLLTVMLPTNFDTTAPFTVAALNSNTFSGNQAGTGGGSSSTPSTPSDPGAGAVPGVPDTGYALQRTLQTVVRQHRQAELVTVLVGSVLMALTAGSVLWSVLRRTKASQPTA